MSSRPLIKNRMAPPSADIAEMGPGAEVNGNGHNSRAIVIPAPKLVIAQFDIRGTTPLVIHRFPHKVLMQMKLKMETGKAASSKKNREPQNAEDLFNESRYVSSEGWDGFHAAAIRCGMISCCRLVSFKMTLAKLSLFVLADGWDQKAPTIPLVRIYGKAEPDEGMARVETGQPYCCIRARYFPWSAKLRIQYDRDQFTIEDVANLLSRVGLQAGICEGRPDSKNSAGMGWGLFAIAGSEQEEAA
jgi:hypothetical protein